MTGIDTATPAHSATPIDVRRGNDRFVTRLHWLDGRHSFSFGQHYDPSNMSHGLLVVSNEDRIAPASGFGTHSHTDMEIVTWMLSGELEHRDSAGHHGLLYPGLAQRMSAGRGIQHSEMNPSQDRACHLVQMWVLPDTPGVAPGYEQRDMNDALDTGGLVTIASGKGHEGALTIHQRHAAMHVARLTPDAEIAVPEAPYVHVFVAKGSVRLGDSNLDQGDAARLTNAGAQVVICGAEPSEIIVWETDLAAR